MIFHSLFLSLRQTQAPVIFALFTQQLVHFSIKKNNLKMLVYLAFIVSSALALTDSDITNEYYRTHCLSTQYQSRFGCPVFDFPSCTPWNCASDGQKSRLTTCYSFDCTVSIIIKEQV